jgi:hypothetical protein
MGMIREIWASTFNLLCGVIRRFYYWLTSLLLDPFDLAEKLLGVTYFPLPNFAIWSLFGIGLFAAVAHTHYEIWQKQTVSLLAKAKAELQEHAEKGHQIFNLSEGIFKTPEGMSTREIVDDWAREGYEIVKKYLGRPAANTFQRTIENQLAHASPNEVPKEGHAISAGIGWLTATAHQIKEDDLKH